LAKQHYDPGLNNRIILATDGDFNVGINSTGDLENYIEQQRGQGIYLTALGFGMGNYKNATLETLADKGDGNHFYINSLEESQRVLVNDIGNLLNLARDVKLNVEFNPNLVKTYRLIGYENRLLKAQDFIDDTKDGGEMGYGHEVTAVYEIERGTALNVETHFVQATSKIASNELAFVKLRYKPFEEKESIERRIVLSQDAPLLKNELLNLVVGFGLQLRDSAFKGTQTIEELKELANKYKPINSSEKELVQFILNYMSK
jgi:Ca-activated chloride channel family protein